MISIPSALQYGDNCDIVILVRKRLSMPQFIYLVTNTINKKQYVGQTSKTVEKRFLQHIRNGNYESNTSLLSKAIKKYGKDKFIIEVIQQFNNITQEELDTAEIKYIKQYNCLMPNGYNKSPGGCVTYLTDDGRERKKRYAKQRWQDKTYKELMLTKNLVKARILGHTGEANIKRGNSLVKDKHYLITTPDRIEYCTYGLIHLTELGLDISALTKVARGKISNHKGYKVKSLNDDYLTVDKKYLDYCNKYECISLNTNNYSFCSYGIEPIKEQLQLDICVKTISHHINNGNLINNYQIKDINAEPVIKQYLPDAERFIFTSPDNVQFCRYGMDGLLEEWNLRPRSMYPLMNPNLATYGRNHKGWSCSRVNESTETREQILKERQGKLDEIKPLNDEKRKWGLVTKNKYLLTNLITNEQLCCYGLTHLKETHDLDSSCLIKVVKGKIKHHKNWTCIKIEDN